MKDIVIFGVGQNAEVIYYYLSREGGRNVVAFTADEAYVTAENILGLPVTAFENIADAYPPESHEMFVAISFTKVNQLRQQKVEAAMGKGYTLTSHVSPRADVWDGFELKPNTIIMEQNVIQPYAAVGRNVVMWSGNHIGHHTTIGDHCFIASHVVVSGNVTVGEGTFMGVNATIRDGISIGKRNVIGANTLILADSADEAVFMGTATTASRVPSSRLRSI